MGTVCSAPTHADALQYSGKPGRGRRVSPDSNNSSSTAIAALTPPTKFSTLSPNESSGHMAETPMRSQSDSAIQRIGSSPELEATSAAASHLTLQQLVIPFSLAPNAVLIFDTNQTVLFANNATETSIGYRHSELVGHKLNEFITHEGLEYLKKMSRTMDLNPRTDRQLHFLTKQGNHHVFSFKVRAQTITSSTDPTVTQTVFLVFLQKLSDEMTSVSLLKNKLLELSSIPILGADERGIMQIFNQSAEEAFGWTSDEIVGKNVKILMPERLARFHDQFIENYLRTGRGKVIDKMRKENALKKDGTTFPIELKMSYVDINGKHLFIGYARDRSAFITKGEQNQRAALADKLFPPSIAARVCEGQDVVYDYHESASLLFCDIKGYTALSSQISPHRMVKVLDSIFSGFDTAILEELNVEKIKTIGDCYMLGSGFPGEFSGHASELVEAAFRMIEVIKKVNEDNPDLPETLQVRFGISSGSVVSGIVGRSKPLYDCFSSTVNFASRMESTGIPGEIQISQDTYDCLSNPKHKALFHQRQGVQVKGRGTYDTWITNLTGHMDSSRKEE